MLLHAKFKREREREDKKKGNAIFDNDVAK